MNKLTTKKRTKKGFTLMEMLIVVAIIAILIAIAIPVFNAQMAKAKLGVDNANLRSATSMAVVDYLTTESPSSSAIYYAITDGNDTMELQVGGTAPTSNEYPCQTTPGAVAKITIVTGGDVSEAIWTTTP